MKKAGFGFKVALLMMVVIFSGCGKKEFDVDLNQESIRSIGDLATMECYYNNVAVLEKKPEKGILHIGEKERKAWIEYTGLVRIGVDMSKVKLEKNGNNVSIVLPKVEVFDVNIVDDTYSEESYYISDDNFFNKNPITAEDQKDMINKAQQEMGDKAKADKELLNRAEERAKALISNYVNEVGKINNINYSIEWK